MALEAFTASGRIRRLGDGYLEAGWRNEKSRPDSKLAILVCKDAASRKWGPKWLEQAGFEIVIATSEADLQLAASNLHPALVVVESTLRSRKGEPLFQWLADSPLHPVPRLVLCASERDVEGAISSGATDVVRKPFNWQLISRRAARTVRSESSLLELDKAQEALTRALNYANDAQASLRRVENIDALTELPNRRMFAETIDRCLSAGRKRENDLAILLIGIDRFRAVNDRIGHAGGNEVLAEVGQRILGCLHRRDLLGSRAGSLATAAAAKLGGVRFGLMVSHGGSDLDLQRIARLVQEELAEPVVCEDRSVMLSASIGISVATRDGASAEQLILNAESALIEVKRRGGGILLFRDDQRAENARRLELEQKLQEAVSRRTLKLHYQPLHCNESGTIVGAEALLRWTCPEEGPISPAEFVPVAEEGGLMVELGDFVIREACRQLRAWLDAGIPELRMSVNLSLIQLLRGNVVRTVREALLENKLAPEQLELELSERGVVQRDPEIMRKLLQLRALGVRLSVDDFGTGDASIAYLKDLPVDTLKIDRSYVSGSGADEKRRVMGSVMVTLGKKLGLEVIAEGVETETQQVMVKEWGCDVSQGFYLSQPVPSDEIQKMLK